MQYAWYIGLGVLVIGYPLLYLWASARVERLTHRKTRPDFRDKRQLLQYDLVFFGISIGVALPTVYLLPEADLLLLSLLIFTGLLVGSLSAQASFGQKVDG
ncbi:hypothetical protein [Aeoliella mucimassa]|uniref:Uncharacterized protein n=1 Tax=Aeoliella mucimassa TaxID=2527972 RepID=A0A518AJ77_9BACT|nr:hypothetical protein [Aeoliella mucimassa]QDU54760.1 hypothetical protein Pan181_09430 [Aeoliella mucimassa]